MAQNNNSDGFLKIVGVIILIVIAFAFISTVFKGLESVIYAIKPLVPYVFWGGIIIYLLSSRSKKNK